MSEYAAFAYTTALNDLLADSNHVKYFGDMTVVYWAEENSAACQNCFAELLESEEECSNQFLDSVMKGVKEKNINFEGTKLNYENPFYILGLSPNSARISIRFFMRKTFGDIIKNLAKHYSDLKIIKPSSKKFENIPLWQILAATIPPNSKEKSTLPLMSGAVVQAVMTRQNYPASLFQNVLLRIKADNNVTYE